MSRIDAALHVLSNYYWAKVEIIRKRRPIYSWDKRIVGYFDTVKVADGITQIDGWIDSPGFHIATEADEAYVVPDLIRTDTQTSNSTPGFSISLRGWRHLAYRFNGHPKSVEISVNRALGSWLSILKATAVLVPFALRNRSDLLRYFIIGNSKAGDRLERAINHLAEIDPTPIAMAQLFGERPLPKIEAPIDIVVPVFNSAEDLRECLFRLDRHTNSMHRKIIVDDASTDPDVKLILNEFSNNTPNVVVLRNQENLGFVKSVNRGLSVATGHVVILNSDAFVPERWLERLAAPILADENVASVTPLSNAAEIFSVPNAHDNSILTPYQVNSIDRALQHLDWQSSLVTAPTGMGFCMILNMQWLKRVPYFDNAFGRGYGEEVDWCQKTAELGGFHVALGTLFVQHRGSSSFGAEKAERLRTSNALIDQRYPNFRREVMRFRELDPLIGPRIASAVASIDQGDEVPVYLAHSLGGGAEYWLTENLQKHLEVGQGAIVLRGKDDPRKLLVEVHTPNGVTQGLIERENTSGLLGIPQKICLNYSCLVAASDPMGIVKDAMASLRQGDRLIVLFHDYFPLCPSYNLIGADGKYCRLPSSSRCEACYVGMISDRLGRYPTIKDWRQSWKEFLDRANEIVTFSIDSKRHVTKVWPDLTPKTVVRPHILQSSPAQVRRPVGSKVVVGVLGGIGYVKGAEVLKRLSKFTDDRFRIVVIGDMDPTFSDARIHVHGKYARKNISELAKSYGVTCWLFPSIWPETFSFALRECLSTGLPVIGFDLGSQAEALREHQNGTVIPTDIEARDLWRFLINRNDAKAFVGRRVPILGEAV